MYYAHSHVPKKKEVTISYQNFFNYYRYCKLRNLKNIKFVQMLELVYNTKKLCQFFSLLTKILVDNHFFFNNKLRVGGELGQMVLLQSLKKRISYYKIRLSFKKF